jgi:hypothetical protein
VEDFDIGFLGIVHRSFFKSFPGAFFFIVFFILNIIFNIILGSLIKITRAFQESFLGESSTLKVDLNIRQNFQNFVSKKFSSSTLKLQGTHLIIFECSHYEE